MQKIIAFIFDCLLLIQNKVVDLPIKNSNIHPMKAIINIKRKSSGFSYLNGHTFEVKEVLSNLVAVQIPSRICEGRFDTCDFGFDEVIIVDIDSEMQKSLDVYNWSGSKLYDNLLNYCTKNGIKTNEKINCPA